MTRARALVAAVPPQVWTAVAGLVLLASLGVTLVLGAGLATWQGAVTHPPAHGSAQPPAGAITAPGSAVIVVPSPATHRTVPVKPRVPTAVTRVPAPPIVVSLPVAVQAPVPVPAPVPVVAAPAVSTTVTAHPRVSGPGDVTAEATTHRHGRGVRGADRRSHRAKSRHSEPAAAGHDNRGKHLGWAKHNSDG